MTKMMRAARLYKIGDPFQIDTIPIPEVRPTDVLGELDSSNRPIRRVTLFILNLFSQPLQLRSGVFEIRCLRHQSLTNSCRQWGKIPAALETGPFFRSHGWSHILTARVSLTELRRIGC